MNSISLISALAALVLMLSACGGAPTYSTEAPTAPIGVPGADGLTVHGRAWVTVTSAAPTPYAWVFRAFTPPTAYAASGSANVTYTNSPSTSFAINASNLVAAGLTGNTLSLGSVSLAGLSDNNLKVCGSGGATKCTQALIRVYTTGSIAGFVNAADAYGAPVYAGTLNPTTALGLGSAGSVPVQTLTIGASKHTVSLADFPSPTYSVTSDFSNAGAGGYSMVFVVEYALQ